jgi:hypothetical protein
MRPWHIIGAAVCIGGYQLLNYGVGKMAGYVFAGVVVVAWLTMHFIYRRRLDRLRDDVAAMSAEERSRFLQQIAPDIAEYLKKKNDNSNG